MLQKCNYGRNLKHSTEPPNQLIVYNSGISTDICQT